MVDKASSDSILLAEGGGVASDQFSASDRIRASETWIVAKTNSGVLIENNDRAHTVAVAHTATWVLILDKEG